MHNSKHPVWLFDLDNTLHDASRHAFPVIDAAMTRFLVERLALDDAAATALRVGYWQRYGATLIGLLRHHPHIDPHEFLALTHPLDILLASLHPMPGLQRTLAQLPGRKILFTNGPQAYAEAILRGIGVASEFEAVHAIEHGGFSPKPHMRSFRHLLHAYQLQPADCVMVEDTVANLHTARRLGMKTVWLRRHRSGHASVDIVLRRLAELPARWRDWCAAHAHDHTS
ncbi:pyrimidine 5'-nucleotidase [Silvimonas soli]|uniref:pyrimidine 5'-nucleotidase n=1 Tax=Silvimonas soli TaxID=2980100 RepID=UPI0024B3892E|nr:pyrimidine 5'-nucleotidase [Silvimonas soli]